MMEKTISTIDPWPDGPEEPLLARARKQQRDETETTGERLARLRRERGITQAELAGMLGVAQPMISGYERGTIRLHGEVIVELTGILSVSADEILGLSQAKTESSPGSRRLLRKLQDVGKLPRSDQQALFRTIDAFLRKAG